MKETASRARKIDVIVLAAILALGLFLRLPAGAFAPGAPLHWIAALHPKPAFSEVGFDEGLYRGYVNALIRGGISSYPDVVESYIGVQQKLPGSILPPVRFLYIFAAYLWHLVFASEALEALKQVAALFSTLTLVLATIVTWRMRGTMWGLGVAALMAVAPTQVHMSQHALVDGFFAFWALLCLWLLWENLRAPGDWRWLTAFVLSLTLMVLTKENSFFVWLALLVLIAIDRWLRFGTVRREVLGAMIIGPLLGVVILVFLAGGIDRLFHTYQLSVSKNFQLTYAVLTGDGPWYRYLVDLLLVSPVVLLLAVGGLFRLDREQKPELYFALFVAASYAVMCNVKYGMNLRYANIWDMPLRFLAVSALVSLVAPFRRYRNLLLGLAVFIVCAIELRQYFILFVQFPLYELVSEGLLRALHILKSQ